MINCTDNTENKLKAEILKFSNFSNPTIQQACIYAKSWSTFKPLLDQIMPADKTIPRMGEYWEN
jgi:hypothetical protein